MTGKQSYKCRPQTLKQTYPNSLSSASPFHLTLPKHPRSLMASSPAKSLIIIAVIFDLAAATNHIVGKPGGSWDLSTSLSSWASSISFISGDNLIFSYSPTIHDVVEVNKTSYAACSAAGAIKTYNSGVDLISLSSAGKRYFICGVPGHCQSGMKLEIDTIAAAKAPLPPSGAATPPRITPSTGSPQPSPSAPSTGSPPPFGSHPLIPAPGSPPPFGSHPLIPAPESPPPFGSHPLIPAPESPPPFGSHPLIPAPGSPPPKGSHPLIPAPGSPPPFGSHPLIPAPGSPPPFGSHPLIPAPGSPQAAGPTPSSTPEAPSAAGRLSLGAAGLTGLGMLIVCVL